MSDSQLLSHDFATAMVVGFGKAGGSLSASLHDLGIVVDVASRQQQRRQRASALVKGVVATTPSDLFAQRDASTIDILFLAVPDDHIRPVADALARAKVLPNIVAHLSGSLGRETLDVIKRKTACAAFHPLAALDGAVKIPEDTLIAIDAADEVAQRLSALAVAMGGQPATINTGGHPRYHAGAVIAGNLPVALVADAIDLLTSVGVSDVVARKGLAKLLESTARALQRGPLPRMLTGPIARGDAATVTRHLDAIDDDDVRARYRELSLRLLSFADVDDDTHSRLKRALSVRTRNASSD